MEKTVKYTIFNTKWGYFGLATEENILLGTILPLPNPKKVESLISKKYPNAEYQKYLMKSLQKKITAYFQGRRTDFNSIPILLDGLRPFTISVLTACRKIPCGRMISYSKIAQKTHCPKAARAVGNALAKNPLPLIIPCHRVVRSDGSCGNFFAAGGKKLKKKLLKLEKYKHI